MNTYTGATLKAVLATITAENLPESLWDKLPEHVAGAQWRGEVWGAARTLSDWLDDSDYELFQLTDLAPSLADSEVEDYYSNINRRVQELSLWAVAELDEEVAVSGIKCESLTDMNAAYLYCAMRGLYHVLAEWAYETAEELAEEVA